MTKTMLEDVDFISSDGKYCSGLVPVQSTYRKTLSIDEQSAIFDAESFKHIDYIFFRRFSDGRSSHISAYVVDNSKKHLDEKELAELHQKVWLQGAAPLLYVAWPSRIDILTCARGPDFWGAQDEESQYRPAKSLASEAFKTANAINSELRKHSALRLADGTFWEDPSNTDLADHAKAAHQSLIQAVVEADSDLDGKNNPILRRLLLLVILIKYLEDRHVFPNQGWFGIFHKGAKSFFEVLQGGNPEEVYRLLKTLERKFNGDVFYLPHEGQQRLTKKNLRLFADLVEARTMRQQRYLWEQFSFEHLPVEIISYLYQRFVQGGHGTVYTPPMLASLLLDHAMPYDKLTGKERVLDPACGSGVFLVGAFRRLINVWRSRNKWKRPDVDALKGILMRSIYGIEIDPSAIDLTAFSLCLAICDALQPDVIWTDLKFDPLRKSNLFEADFFRILLDARQGKSALFEKGFDVVVGNPPFESELSAAGTKINNVVQSQDIHRGSLPDKQSAYLFLEQALSILRSNGRACLIQPSGLLYNLNAQNFRTALYKKYKVDTILDFTSIRKLYDAADPKTIAVLVNDSAPSKNHVIAHLTFRRTVSVHHRICFELDHYDHHSVSQKKAEAEQYVWRANLLGGGRLHELSQRLLSMRTLEEYLTDCMKHKGWDYGEGFIVAKTGRREPAPFLTGKPLIPTTAFTNACIDATKIETVKATHFRSAYTENRYSAPLVMIKEISSLPIAYWDNGFLAYRDKIVGIHAPRSQASILLKLHDTLLLNHNIYQFSCTLNGTQSLIGKATAILKHDIDKLPYPEDMNDLSFSFWEDALREDVLNYMTEYIRLGQNSELLRKLADLKDLHEYSNMFLRMLGSVYDNLDKSSPVFFNGLICQPFYFGNRPNLSWLIDDTTNELQELIYNDETHKHLRTIRVLRFYSENVLLLVKPDRLRYWTRSTAIRDADETLIDLRQQGY